MKLHANLTQLGKGLLFCYIHPMQTKRIDVLNLYLILGSCLLAFVLPFELFLFSYAVLGPLHYITEIRWLHKHCYFTEAKKDYLVLIVLALFCFLAVFIFKVPSAFTLFVFLALSFALASVTITKLIPKIVFILIATAAAFLLKWKLPVAYVLVGLFLPTIIHVFFFTGVFMLFGALKNRSLFAIVTVIAFLLCSLSFFLFDHISVFQTTEYAKGAYKDSGMTQLNAWLARALHIGKVTSAEVFQSPTALKVMRFIAFAYTYHYLNWFSKTEIIKWNLVPAFQMRFMIAVWVICVSLYAYNYKTGLSVLYILSLLHVLLELPLNIRSIGSVGTELNKIASMKRLLKTA